MQLLQEGAGEVEQLKGELQKADEKNKNVDTCK